MIDFLKIVETSLHRVSSIRAQFFIIGLTILFLSSCVNYKLHYTQQSKFWPSNLPDTTQTIEHTMFLIGDAGGATLESQLAEKASAYKLPALTFLKKKLSEANENSTVVFLGDNIYPNGMAPKAVPDERTLDEIALKAQLGILENFKGRPFFIAGNHDWYKYGLGGVKRQKKFIEEYLGRDDVFLPKPGCGDPVEIEINDNLTLILLDTQWWLQDWSKEPEVNDGCEAKSREVFALHVKEALRDHRDKNVVVALHHPLYTMGSHGGQFSIKQHLFPLTDKFDNLWIPFPILGSIYPFYRSTIGVKQDLAHPSYRALKELLIEASEKNGHYIFASGHEHSLQYLEKDGQSYIVSGSGTKRTPAKLGDGWKFAYGEQGFAQLDFYKDGTVWLQFWVPNEEGSDGMVVYRQKIKGPLEKIEQRAVAKMQSYDFYNSKRPTVNRELSELDFSKGKLGTFFLGKHYREVYNAELEIPVLDLATFEGGVFPVQMGGGFQTNSLRLEGKTGKQYTMRSVDKDATKTVPYAFSNSVVTTALKDFFSSAHPLSALPIPIMADAIGVYHTNPKLYYVPRQPNLQEFNELYGDALYLVEERPDDDVWKDKASFGRPQDIRSTSSMLEKTMEKHTKLIDQRAVLRARLFDLVLGDWDRHDDQWRWAEFDIKKDSTVFRPIPRDRDQAFSNYDGLLVGVARYTIPFVRQLRTYDDELKKLQWSSYNARQFDRAYLAAMDWQDWQKEALHIQLNLKNEVIDQAFKDAWPPSIYDIDAPRIISSLKSRRDDLLLSIRPLYEAIAEKVDVRGTDSRDLFAIERYADSTIIKVYDTNKEGDREKLFYQRTFYSKETKVVNLYGLDDDDIFEITGGTSNLKIRLIGGLGEDTYHDNSLKSGIRANNIIYDTKEEDNLIQGTNNSKLRLSDNPKYITYNRKSQDYEYDFGMFLPSIGVNPDDGLLLGFSSGYTAYGFKKAPYAVKHNLSASYALETSGLRVKYTGEFVEILGNWSLNLNGIFQSPLYANNFYGLGNETENLEDILDDDFYRIRQRHIEIAPVFQKPVGSIGKLNIGPIFQSTRIENTENRIINELAPIFDPEIFEGFEFLGLVGGFEFKNVNDITFPTRGVQFNTQLGWKTILDDPERNFAFWDANLAIYQQLSSKGNLALALQWGFQHRFNSDFPFYQGAQLGGTGPNRNFRGFRRERFVGNTAFVQNTDLRWKAFKVLPNSFPTTIGFFTGFDYGRVWLRGEDSDVWHYSYGGGIWLSPFDAININMSMFRTDTEFNRFTLGGQFFF